MTSIGIDLGTTKKSPSAISIILFDQEKIINFHYKTIDPKGSRTRDEKLNDIYIRLKDIIIMNKPDVVAIEYPGNVQGHARILLELHGALRFFCSPKYEFLSIPQKTLKKFATNDGNAAKEEIINAATFESGCMMNSHEADAFWLAYIGMSLNLSLDDIEKEYRKKIITGLKKH